MTARLRAAVRALWWEIRYFTLWARGIIPPEHYLPPKRQQDCESFERDWEKS